MMVPLFIPESVDGYFWISNENEYFIQQTEIVRDRVERLEKSLMINFDSPSAFDTSIDHGFPLPPPINIVPMPSPPTIAVSVDPQRSKYLTEMAQKQMCEHEQSAMILLFDVGYKDF